MATAAQKRGSARETLLRAAIDAIDEHGEAGVRLDDVLTAAGASVSSLYHHYGNLRGLVERAQLERFAQAYSDNVGEFLRRLETITAREEVIELIEQTVAAIYSTDREVTRQQRLHSLGAVYQNSQLRASVAELEKNSAERTATAVRELQRRGFVPVSIDPYEWSLWFNTQVYALAVVDLLGDDRVRRAWIRQVADATLRSFGLL